VQHEVASCIIKDGLSTPTKIRTSLRGMVVDERGCKPPARDVATGTFHQLFSAPFFFLVLSWGAAVGHRTVDFQAVAGTLPTELGKMLSLEGL
jgi:hypothetical protein